jgi:DNA modification methylase
LDTTQKLTVEMVAIDRLFCSPSNPRLNEPAVPHVAASIKRFGFRQPIVARPSGEVIAGNTRLKAAQSLGLTEVPVAWFDGSDLEATAYAIADNRTAEFAEWDDQSLAALLDNLRAEDALDGVGFSDDEIDQLLAQLAEEQGPVELEDPGPGEPPEQPTSRLGDLWVLGEHRLLCGDSTSADATGRLMNGQRAHLLATDPPYLVDYTAQNHPPSASNRPETRDKNWDTYTDPQTGIAFFDAFLKACLPHVVPDAAIYQWHASRRQSLVERAWEQNGLLVHQTIVWVKPRPVLTRSMFMWRSEPCFVGWVQGNMPPKDRRPPTNATNVWEIEQCTERLPHPTLKPLEVFTRPLQYHTRPGEIALEPFSGSGTQIIAAEQTRRRCYAMELSPAFVDVAVRRWEQATGKEAVLDGDGRTFAEIAVERGGDEQGADREPGADSDRADRDRTGPDGTEVERKPRKRKPRKKEPTP